MTGYQTTENVVIRSHLIGKVGQLQGVATNRAQAGKRLGYIRNY